MKNDAEGHHVVGKMRDLGIELRMDRTRSGDEWKSGA